MDGIETIIGNKTKASGNFTKTFFYECLSHFYSTFRDNKMSFIISTSVLEKMD